MQSPPTSSAEFEAFMEQLDRKLIEDGVDIPSRPIFAALAISKQFNLRLPGGGAPTPLTPEEARNKWLSDAIHQWFDARYGKRLDEISSILKIAIPLDGDLYFLNLPRIIGKVQFIVSHHWHEKKIISNQTPLINVIQLIEDVTPARANSLSDQTLGEVWRVFNEATMATYTLLGTQHQLMHIARSDAEVAANKLMAVGNRYGDSRWASLQAAEKVLKAALDLQGVKFEHTHDLTKLRDKLHTVGLDFDATAQIEALQCWPPIRYEEQLSTREEALVAHHAFFELVNILRNAGANFSCGIGGPQP